MVEIFLIALALAADATVYSFSYGLVLRCNRMRHSLRLAVTVGVFQALMPLLGYLGGNSLRSWVDEWKDGIVLAVFLGLGIYVIYHAWKDEEEENTPACGCPLGITALLLVGLATAIDAMAVGIAMALGEIGGANPTLSQLLQHVGIIGAITLVCSLTAFHSARLLHHFPTRWLETLAGLLLICLGIQSIL